MSKTAKTSVPLACQNFDDFENLDAEEKMLIRSGATELVMIEEASNLVDGVKRSEIDGEWSLNLILQEIASVYKVKYLPWDIFYGFEPDNKDPCDGVKILKSVEKYRKTNAVDKLKDLTVTIIALDFGDIGGHFGAVLYDPKNKEVHLFDSMQGNEIEDWCHEKGCSTNTWQFECLLKLIFRGAAIKRSREFTEETSLQFTGGFSGTEPYSIIKWRRENPTRSLGKLAKLIDQSTESQNHFCYMWSLWAIQHHLEGMDVAESAASILSSGTDPLVVIKIYIWQLFRLRLGKLSLIDYIPVSYRRFFEVQFPGIWTNDPHRKFSTSTDFARYVIKMPSAPKNIRECLRDSLAGTLLMRESIDIDKNQIIKMCKL